jgi:hypothetical protein
MSKLKDIRTALADQLQTMTGVAASPYVPDSITPPLLAIKSGDTNYVNYEATMDGVQEYNLEVLILLAYTPSTEAAQAAVDDLIDGGPQEDGSVGIIPAIQGDPTLGGEVDYIEANGVTKVGLLEISGQSYFSARVSLAVSR